MSRGRKNWEILVGDIHKLDWLSGQTTSIDQDPYENAHPLQEVMEQLIEDILTDKEKQVFYMRFGERASHREIARRMGYKAHRVIQVIEDNIMRKIKEALES